MIIRGGNKGPKFSERKWNLAMRLMQRDYSYITKHSNMFVMMSKKEESDWEATTINNYYWHYTIAELEKMIENGTSVLVTNI